MRIQWDRSSRRTERKIFISSCIFDSYRFVEVFVFVFVYILLFFWLSLAHNIYIYIYSFSSSVRTFVLVCLFGVSFHWGKLHGKLKEKKTLKQSSLKNVWQLLYNASYAWCAQRVQVKKRFTFVCVLFFFCFFLLLCSASDSGKVWKHTK